MADLTDDDIDAALEAGRLSRLTEPRIAAARYDRGSGRMVIDLTNGCTFLFPPQVLQGLETASDDEIAEVEILGGGSGLHWDVGGADYSIAGLLAGRFGTKAYMEARQRNASARVQGEPALRAG